jgi:hypothetical protein
MSNNVCRILRLWRRRLSYRPRFGGAVSGQIIGWREGTVRSRTGMLGRKRISWLETRTTDRGHGAGEAQETGAWEGRRKMSFQKMLEFFVGNEGMRIQPGRAYVVCVVRHSGFLVQRCEASVRRASGCKAVFRALENEPERAVNVLNFSMMRVNPE